AARRAARGLLFLRGRAPRAQRGVARVVGRRGAPPAGQVADRAEERDHPAAAGPAHLLGQRVVVDRLLLKADHGSWQAAACGLGTPPPLTGGSKATSPPSGRADASSANSPLTATAEGSSSPARPGWSSASRPRRSRTVAPGGRATSTAGRPTRSRARANRRTRKLIPTPSGGPARPAGGVIRA